MVISLELFKKCMLSLEAQIEKDHLLGELLVDKECSGWVSTAPLLMDCVIDLLQDNLDDDDGDWICWWLWEKEEGKTDHIWTDYKGEKYRFEIKDVEDLYYLIIDDMDKIKEKFPDNPKELEDAELSEGFGKMNQDAYEEFMNTIFGCYKESEN